MQSGQMGNFVYTIADNKAKLVPVIVGVTQDDETVVTSGLNGGEDVVTEGALLLTNGSSVVLRKPVAKAN